MVSKGRKRVEPEPLRRGKAFHRMIQEEWARKADGDVQSERTVLKPSGRRGRVDIFVDDDDPDGCIAIVEIKASDWDRMTDQAVKRNIRRQIRQVWGYIESQILVGEYVSTGEHQSVSPGMVFPKRPNNPKRLELIEHLFNEEGIAVDWHDESLEECRLRHQRK